MITRAEIEARVREDAARLAGRIILVQDLDGCVCGQGAVRHCYIIRPVRARVLLGSSSIVRWVDDYWCDPVYDVELLDDRPDLADLSSAWLYGSSHSVTGRTVPALFVVEAE